MNNQEIKYTNKELDEIITDDNLSYEVIMKMTAEQINLYWDAIAVAISKLGSQN